jgi:sugar phosphate isomerase/epimerase
MSQVVTFSVFLKPWRTTPLPELARIVQGLGVTAVELPVRPGFAVEPEQIGRDLPEAIRIFADHGLAITSVATEPTPAAIAACGELSIPLIRVMAPIGPEGYMAATARLRGEYERLAPRLADARVLLGVQNHSGAYVAHAMGLRQLLDGFDPQVIGAVWDAAHNALSGEDPAHAIDIIWPQLAMVNLKNAFWRRISGPEAADVTWRPYWTSGRQGLASWPRVAQLLRQRGYAGVVCLPAEYSDEADVARLIAGDVAYAQSLWADGLEAQP